MSHVRLKSIIFLYKSVPCGFIVYFFFDFVDMRAACLMFNLRNVDGEMAPERSHIGGTHSVGNCANFIILNVN